MPASKTFCVLLDPDKPECYEVTKACIEAKDLINKYGVEVWVGTSKENFQKIRNYTKILGKWGISNIVIFPGRPDHALCYGKNISKVFRPYLLNYTKPYINFYVGVGKFLTTFFDIVFRDKKSEDYGYLTIGPHSTVGRKLGSLPLNEREILSKLKDYSNKVPNGKGVYLEAGSGASETWDSRMIKRAREILPEKMKIIVGGGIGSVEKVKEFFDAGADKVVVGTFFEKNPRNLKKFIQKLYEE